MTLSLGSPVVVFITTSKPDEAERIARALVERGLAACVNIVRDLRSVFVWRGKIEEAQEALMIVKTRLDKLDELIKLVKSEHSYEVPEVIAVPVVYGHRAYLDWLNDVIEGRERPRNNNK